MINEAVIRPQPLPLPGKWEVKDVLVEFLSLDDDRWEVIRHCTMKLDDGERKYGSPLMSHNGRSADLDMYQDTLDSINYGIQALMEERDPIVAAQRNHEVMQLVEIANNTRLRLVKAGVLTDGS